MNLLTNDNGISRSLILFGTREEDKKYILKYFKYKYECFRYWSQYWLLYNFLSQNINKGRILAIEPSRDNLELM